MRRNNVVRLGLFLLCSVVFALPPAYADVVTDWNQKALALMSKEGLAGGYQTRALAMLHVAMFDALNSIENRYTPYKAKYAVDPATSKEAAAASAAYAVLIRLFPKTARGAAQRLRRSS